LITPLGLDRLASGHPDSSNIRRQKIDIISPVRSGISIPYTIILLPQLKICGGFLGYAGGSKSAKMCHIAKYYLAKMCVNMIYFTKIM
jgi:hypothetical protein